MQFIAKYTFFKYICFRLMDISLRIKIFKKWEHSDAFVPLFQKTYGLILIIYIFDNELTKQLHVTL